MRWSSATVGLLLATGAATLAAGGAAAEAPRARLVSYPVADCLLVSGRRASADAQVFINDHPVAVEGGRRWRVRLPLDTLRAWSPSRARTLSVTTADRGGDGAATTQLADLPIGLLGHRIDLAMLTVRVH